MSALRRFKYKAGLGIVDVISNVASFRYLFASSQVPVAGVISRYGDFAPVDRFVFVRVGIALKVHRLIKNCSPDEIARHSPLSVFIHHRCDSFHGRRLVLK
jgi:hypothetical protein